MVKFKFFASIHVRSRLIICVNLRPSAVEMPVRVHSRSVFVFAIFVVFCVSY